jgi:hypothetical protein
VLWASAPVRCLSPIRPGTRPAPRDTPVAGRTVLRLPPPRSRPIVWPSAPGMPACRAPSGPWRSYHGGRSPPPSLIPGAHQVPARAMGQVSPMADMRGCSCENYFAGGAARARSEGFSSKRFQWLGRRARQTRIFQESQLAGSFLPGRLPILSSCQVSSGRSPERARLRCLPWMTNVIMANSVDRGDGFREAVEWG